MPLLEFTGAAVITALADGISASATSLKLQNGGGWPTGSVANFVATIGDPLGGDAEEKILCSNRASDGTVTIAQRGYDGTPTQAWPANTRIRHTISAAWAMELSLHVHDTTRNDHTQYLRPVDHAAISHTEAMLGADSVGPTELQDDAVTTAKILDGTITTDDLADLLVTNPKLAADAVTAAKILDGTITADKETTLPRFLATSTGTLPSVETETSVIVSWDVDSSTDEIVMVTQAGVPTSPVGDSGNGIRFEKSGLYVVVYYQTQPTATSGSKRSIAMRHNVSNARVAHDSKPPGNYSSGFGLGLTAVAVIFMNAGEHLRLTYLSDPTAFIDPMSHRLFAAGIRGTIVD